MAVIARHGARRGRAAIVVASIAVLVPVAAAAAPPPPSSARPAICRPDHSVPLGRDGWFHLPSPVFEGGPPEIRQVLLDRWHADVSVLVTNGYGVVRWSVQQCRWDTVPRSAITAGSELPVAGGEVVLTGVRRPEHTSQGRPRLVYVYGNQLLGPLQRPFVRRTEDAGTTWLPSDGDLAGAGRLADLQAGPNGCAWALTQPAGGPLAGGYRVSFTEDGGTTWRAVQELVAVDGLRPDPTSCRRVWAWRGGVLLHSQDSGATFTEIGRLPAEVGEAVVSRTVRADTTPGREGQAVVGEAVFSAAARDAPRVFQFGEQTAKVSELAAPDVAAGLADAGRPGMLAVVTGSGLYVHDPVLGRWTDVTPDGPAVRGVDAHLVGSIDGRAGRFRATLVAHSEREVLVRRTAGEHFLPTTTRLRRLALGPAGELHLGASAFTPERVELVLRTGEAADVPFAFAIPGRLRPLDVDFVVDTTTSMTRAIDSLRRGMTEMAGLLDGAGVDLRIGLAEFRDIGTASITPEPGSSPNPEEPILVYRRRLRLQPPGAALTRALAALRVGGGGDPEEAQTVALTQAVAGSGNAAASVPPGQEAGYRPQAVKLAVLVTDSPFHQGGAYPTVTETTAVLRAAGVRLLGVVVLNGNDADAAERDERQVALGTGSLAPAGGLDCDGDGLPEVPAGGPMVCRVLQTATGIGSTAVAVRRLVLDAVNPAPASIRLAGDTDVVHRFTGGREVVLDRRVDRRLSATARFGCSATQAGHRFGLTAEATLHGAVVARSPISVSCLGAAAVAGPVAPPGAPPPRAAAAAVPEPAAPGAIQLPNAPVTNPNPQPNLQANGGFAPEDADEPQLAYAAQPGGAPEDPVPIHLLVGAAMAAAAALAVHHRGQVARAERRIR